MVQHERRSRFAIELLLVAALFSAALFVRTYQLDAFPPGLYNDEAAYGLDGQSVLDGNFAIFFERNNGREPLFIYLLGLAFRFLGATPYTIRLTAALVGAVTVVTTYWMVREIFRFAPEEQEQPPVWFAAWAALFLAFSYWHLSFSRLGFRAIALPLVTTIAFALLWRTWRLLRTAGPLPWPSALLAGLALGLTLYTYTAGRMAFLLFLATVAATFLLAPHFAINRRRLLKSAGLTLLAALIAALPILIYFAAHPAYFGQHAAEISIFNPRYSGGNPFAALQESVSRTLLMFFAEPDRNLRHNPGQTPLFDPLLAIWLAVGIGLAAFYWRRLVTLFTLLWFLIFLSPALFSAEGVPHSLRSIGVLPAVYLLPLIAMAWVSKLPPPRFQPAMRWIPLPFLLLAAAFTLNAYFNGWNTGEKMRAAFLTDIAQLATSIAVQPPADELWLLPLPPTEDLVDRRLNTVDFILQGSDALVTLDLNEATTPAALAALTKERRHVYVLRTLNVPGFEKYETKFMDTRGLLDFLLRRNGGGEPLIEGIKEGIPYTQYDLVGDPSFDLPDTERPADLSFADSIRLSGFSLGGASDAAWEEDAPLRLTADLPIWVILRWQASAPIPTQFKTSLFLEDDAGNRAAQVDSLLTNDRYPGAFDWRSDETASTYHILDLLPGLPPGPYTLRLLVYADESGQILPVHLPDGSSSSSAPLAQVEILPPRLPAQAPTPQHPLANAFLHPDLQILGFDIPGTLFAPGDAIPLTLYFRSPSAPQVDLSLDLALRNSDGISVSHLIVQPGGPSFPTSAWRTNEVLRSWAALPTDPDTPDGDYSLVIALAPELAAQPQPDRVLATLQIAGRPHTMQQPATPLPTDITFVDAVRLRGLTTLPPLTLEPGATFTATLLWQPIAAQLQPLVRFVHLLDQTGRIVAQQDAFPCAGICPATSWAPDEYLLDPLSITLPPDLPDGDYQIVTGWYRPDTQQRIPAADPSGDPLPDQVATLPLTLHVQR